MKNEKKSRSKSRHTRKVRHGDQRHGDQCRNSLCSGCRQPKRADPAVAAITIVVENISELREADVSNLRSLDSEEAGCVVARVESLECTEFLLVPESAEEEDPNFTIPAFGGGNWLRLDAGNPVYARQFAWFVDPQNSTGSADDENDGKTAATALASMRELSARLIEIEARAYEIQLLSEAVDTDVWRPAQLVSSRLPDLADGELASDYGSYRITVRGQRTTVAGGTLATSIPTDPATNTQANASAAGANLALFIGDMIVTNDGATAWILSDQGGGVVRLSNWWNIEGMPLGFTHGEPAPTPAPGTAFRIVRLTRWAVPITGGGTAHQARLRFADLDMHGSTALTDVEFEFRGVKFSGVGFVAGPLFEDVQTGNVVIDGSLIAFNQDPFAAAVPIFSSIFFFAGCGFLGCSMEIVDQGWIALADCVFQGSNLFHTATVDSNIGSPTPPLPPVPPFITAIAHNAAGGGALVTATGLYGLGVFDSLANGIAVRRCATFSITTGLYGSGNAKFGAVVEVGGRLLIEQFTPTITGLMGELLFEGGGAGGLATPTAIPPLVGGLPVPAEQSLATWAEWNAPPFSRYVFSYKTGAKIIEYASVSPGSPFGDP